VAADTDFGELLAKQGLALPSLVLFRQGNRGPEHQAATLLDNLDYVAEDLAAGAMVVFTDAGFRRHCDYYTGAIHRVQETP